MHPPLAVDPVRTEEREVGIGLRRIACEVIGEVESSCLRPSRDRRRP